LQAGGLISGYPPRNEIGARQIGPRNESQPKKGDVTMSGKTNFTRDAFGFSLRGLRAASSYATAMAVADDGINAAWDERLKLKQESSSELVVNSGTAYGRFWLSRYLRVTWTKEPSTERN